MVATEINGELFWVHCLWDSNRDYLAYGGMDVAAYVGGGMVVWPCGERFQQAGRDGFEEDMGNDDCRCDLCNRFRDLLKDEMPWSPNFFTGE